MTDQENKITKIRQDMFEKQLNKFEKQLNKFDEKIENLNITELFSEIQTTLVSYRQDSLAARQLLQKDINDNNKRINKLESNHTWLFRLVIGAIISATIAFIVQGGIKS